MEDMRLGKSIDAYVKIVERAWQTTWNHKEWWIIAAFAGLANTGGVFSSVFNTFWRLAPADVITNETITNVFPAISWLLAYARNLIALPAGDRLISLAIFTVSLAIVLLLAVTSQHLLLRAVKKGHGKTQPFTWKVIKKDLSHFHVARLLSIDACLFIIVTLLVTGSSIPLSLLLTNDASINLFLYAGVYAIILPIAFLISIVGMLSLIYISQKDLSLGKALREGLMLTQKHWLAALELSIILFFINLIASLLFFFILFLVAIGMGVLFELAFALNAYLLMAVITFLGILLAGAVTVLYAGAMTMLSYSTWSAFAAYTRRARHAPIIEHVAQLAQKTFAR